MGNKAKTVILIVILALIVGGYYFYLSNKTEAGEDNVEVTKVQEVLLRNLDTNYPPTPKEVVKYYSEISKCLYNEEYTDEQLEQMADKLLAIYDAELVAQNEREDYIKKLKEDVDLYHEKNYTITNYTLSSSTDVEEYTKAGREMAQLYCIYTIRSGAEYSSNQQVFVLRKDTETKHWKIMGFSDKVPEETD